MVGASNPFLVGIAGGTGSGKSTLARALAGRYAAAGTALVEQDSYYLDRSHLSRQERAALNFDEPAAVDFELLGRDLRRLAQGVAIEKPRYSFVEHARTGEFDRVEPAPLVIVEGLFAFWDGRVREQMGLRVFLEAEEPVRLARRLERDLNERGRTRQSVIAQFETTVRPMHRRYVEPMKSLASLVLDTTATPIEFSIGAIQRALLSACPALCHSRPSTGSEP